MESSFHDEALNVCSSISSNHCYEFPPLPSPKPYEEETIAIPLSPDSRKYKKKISLLKDRYEEIQTNNDALRNRLLQMQKEITQQEKLRKMLVFTLEARGDTYYNTAIKVTLPPEEPEPEVVVEVEKEKKKRERKERDRAREKARKAAKREADRKAKLDAEMEKQKEIKEPTPLQSLLQSRH